MTTIVSPTKTENKVTVTEDSSIVTVTEDTATVSVISGSDGVAGVDGATGATGASGASVLSGEGVPSSGLGSDGDHYLDQTFFRLHVKADGAWVDQGAYGGDQGPAGTIAIGTTSNVAAGGTATVTNTGSSTAATLNFGLVTGNTGPPGDDGDDGAAAGFGTPTVESGSLAISSTGPDAAKVFGFTLPPGATGSTGASGVSTGHLFTWDSSTTDSDKGDSKVWLNNSDTTLASIVYLDVNAGSTALSITAYDVEDWIKTFDDSTNTPRGVLKLTKHGNADNSFAMYNITQSATKASGGSATANSYWKVPATHVVGDQTTAFSAGDDISVSFVRTGDMGAGGSQGIAGTHGVAAGHYFEWNTDTDDADKGSKQLWADNSTMSSVDFLYIDNEAGSSEYGADPYNVEGWTNSFDDSTNSANRGQIKITKAGNQENNFVVFNVEGAIVDRTTHLKIPVNLAATAGSFSDGDDVSVSFVRTGDTGSQGTAGTNGDDGADGADALESGVLFNWRSLIVDDNGNNGDIFCDSLYLNQATVLRIDDQDANGINIENWRGTFDNNLTPGNYGFITLRKAYDNTKWVKYRVTGAPTQDGYSRTYDNVAVSHIENSATYQNNQPFADSDLVSLTFTETGAAGDSGAVTSVAPNVVADPFVLSVNSGMLLVECNVAKSDTPGLMNADDFNKLAAIPGGAEANVQSDWNATTGDAFIDNKPTIPSGNAILDWTADQGSTNIHAGNVAAAADNSVAMAIALG